MPAARLNGPDEHSHVAVRRDTTHRHIRQATREHDWNQPSPLRATGRAVFFFGAFIAGETIAQTSIAARAIVLVALMFVFTGAWGAVHDATHNSLYRSKRANHAARILWAWTQLLNPSYFREMHLQHHAYTRIEPGWQLGNYPNLKSFWKAVAFGGLGQYEPSMRETFGVFAGHYPNYMTPGHKQRFFWESVATAAFLAATAATAVFVAPVLWLAWFLPLAVYVLVWDNLLIEVEHYGLGFSTNPTEFTRTLKLNPVTQWLAWNQNHHAAHHVDPTVCYRHLPKVTALLEDHEHAGVFAFRYQTWRELRAGTHPDRPAANVDDLSPYLPTQLDYTTDGT